jgi:hypothetical protein
MCRATSRSAVAQTSVIGKCQPITFFFDGIFEIDAENPAGARDLAQDLLSSLDHLLVIGVSPPRAVDE